MKGDGEVVAGQTPVSLLEQQRTSRGRPEDEEPSSSDEPPAKRSARQHEDAPAPAQAREPGRQSVGGRWAPRMLACARAHRCSPDTRLRVLAACGACGPTGSLGLCRRRVPGAAARCGWPQTRPELSWELRTRMRTDPQELPTGAVSDAFPLAATMPSLESVFGAREQRHRARTGDSVSCCHMLRPLSVDSDNAPARSQRACPQSPWRRSRAPLRTPLSPAQWRRWRRVTPTLAC